MNTGKYSDRWRSKRRPISLLRQRSQNRMAHATATDACELLLAVEYQYAVSQRHSAEARDRQTHCAINETDELRRLTAHLGAILKSV